jgi:thiol-disulfide isomerase/thioredoxin
VDAAFAARQRLQQLEVAELRRELHSIQQTIAARERLKDKIIERRVSDLLNPQLRWNTAAKGMANPSQASSGHPPISNQTAMLAENESDDSPLAARRKELEERRKTLFEDIVGIELSQIEAYDATSKDYVKRLYEEDLKRLSVDDRKRFEVEVEKAKNRSNQFDDRMTALKAELNVIEKQIEHLDSRLRESDKGYGSTLNPSAENRFPNPPRTSVIFFHADWCLTCAAIKPEIKKLEADGLPIIFRDLTRNDAAAKLAGLNTIPAFELWVDGQFKERVEGRNYGPLIEKLRAALAGKNVAFSYKALTPTSSTTSVPVLEARLASAESELKRVEILYRSREVTDTSLEKAKLEVEVLKQQLADARRVRNAEEQLLVIDIKSAQLEFEAAAVELTRMEELNKRNPSVISASELDRLRLTVGQGELAVQRAKAKLDLHRGQAEESPDKE